MEIFIHKFDRKDRDAMRDMATESKHTIGGLHLYACKHLSSWLRYGKYLIKWDSAVWVLGLSKGLTYDQKNVKYGKDGCNIDFITELIISKYGDDFEDCPKDVSETMKDRFGYYGYWYSYAKPTEAFAELINKIFGKDTWEKNPYRIGYEFTLIK